MQAAEFLELTLTVAKTGTRCFKIETEKSKKLQEENLMTNVLTEIAAAEVQLLFASFFRALVLTLSSSL